MLTSTDDMQSCVNSLKYREPRNTSVLIGHYKLHENTATLVLRKPENKVNHSNLYWKRRRERLTDKGVRTFRVVNRDEYFFFSIIISILYMYLLILFFILLFSFRNLIFKIIINEQTGNFLGLVSMYVLNIPMVLRLQYA